MKYGYFDVENKEYVVTRPDTPTPWFNYLGNGGYSCIISNNAGGLSFDGDPGNRRITRYRYNTMPMDRPGKYIYIKDMETGEYWSATWQPVMKQPDFYECRHGLGYTTIKTSTCGIEAETTYFIPEGKNYEVWSCKLKNVSGRERKLKIFSYVEFSYWNANIDLTCEWARYEMLAEHKDGVIISDPAAEMCTTGLIYGVTGMSLPTDGFECSRDRFLGAYRNEQNPIALERGSLTDSEENADNLCGSLSSSFTLGAEEEKDFIVTLGTVRNKADAKALVEEATNAELAKAALKDIKAKWEAHITKCQINTPDEDVNKMINIWHAYQCKMTFDWSRFISYYERGIVRGWGFRDSMQDVLGVMHAIPEKAKERIKLLLSIQRQDGNARDLYFPATKESRGGDRSDDHIWSIFSVCTYIRETGDYGFLDEVVPFVDGGEGTVKDHLMRGLEFTRNHLGAHGIPLFLNNDWNDSIFWIHKDGKAESGFVFFQLSHALYELKQLFTATKDTESFKWAEEYYDWCKEKYHTLWDGKWFLRAFLDNGEKFGTQEDETNNVFLNPQSWAVLSRLPSKEEANSAFDEVFKQLFCEFGLISHSNASPKYAPEKKSFFAMSNGVKENGGVFCHANTWAIIAETILGRNDEAFTIYKASLPARRNDISDRTLTEPYVYGSAMLGPAHPRFGAGSNSWLTGTASWMYFAVTQYILGFRPDYDGIVIDPCIPNGWEGFTMERMYRGTLCKVKCPSLPYENARAKAVMVDGKKLESNFIPAKLTAGKKDVSIEVIF